FQGITEVRQTLKDPNHEHTACMEQVSVINGIPNGGFVTNYMKNFPDVTTEELENLMGVYPLGFLPFTHQISPMATVCDRYHASFLGPTWLNLDVMASGTCNGETEMPNDLTDKQFLSDMFKQRQKTLMYYLRSEEHTSELQSPCN